MAFTPRTWVARLVQYPGRRRLTPTGNTNEYDVARSEGSITAAGDVISAENLNDLENRIYTAIDAAGSQFVILGHYATLSALQTAHATGSAGNAYSVGTVTPYDVYVWGVDAAAWQDVGPIASTKGDKGDTGDAATIAVGRVTTGAAGSSATVTNSGTTGAAVFDFAIPQGTTGATGAAGEKGEKGDSGTSFTILGLYATLSALQTAHPTGSAGNAYAVGTAESNTIYNWDIGTSAWVNIGNLQGIQGVAGNAATIAVGTVTTGAAGSEASINNSGTTSAAVFDFAIPQGSKGDKGDKGDTGESGLYQQLTTGTELLPNKKYDFGEVGTLTLTLSAPTAGVANEYVFSFKSGSTATTLSLPSGVKWLGGSAPTIAINKSYLVAIVYADSEYRVISGEF